MTEWFMVLVLKTSVCMYRGFKSHFARVYPQKNMGIKVSNSILFLLSLVSTVVFAFLISGVVLVKEEDGFAI
jgi:hypothetical protein